MVETYFLSLSGKHLALRTHVISRVLDHEMERFSISFVYLEKMTAKSLSGSHRKGADMDWGDIVQDWNGYLKPSSWDKELVGSPSIQDMPDIALSSGTQSGTIILFPK